VEDLMRNEESGYPVSDPNKTVINVTNEPRDTHKIIPSKRKSWKRLLRNSEKILDIVNEKVQGVLKKYQHTKNK
jgi:hypothetical protein